MIYTLKSYLFIYLSSDVFLSNKLCNDKIYELSLFPILVTFGMTNSTMYYFTKVMKGELQLSDTCLAEIVFGRAMRPAITGCGTYFTLPLIV